MNLILRTIPDLIVMSRIPSETPNKLQSPTSFTSTNTTSNLKRVTLRFANYADMVETPLRPITNSGIWRSIMAPTYSTMIQWSIEPLTYETNSLCDTILYLSEIRSSVSPYLVQSRYWQVLFTRSVVCDILWSNHMLASQLDDIPPRGPRVYLSVIGMDKSHSLSIFLYSHFPNT